MIGRWLFFSGGKGSEQVNYGYKGKGVTIHSLVDGEGNPRCAILIAYNHVTVRFHEPKPCMNPMVIGGLSEERQKFFRDVWILGHNRDK